MIKNNHKKGFTLIELLVVISIISLISAVILASLNEARSRAKVSKLMSDLIQIRNAAELYKTDTGNYPVSGSSVAMSGLIPKYLQQVPINPFDSTKNYVLRTEMFIGTYYYCSGKNISVSEYENGKLFIYTSMSDSLVKKELFSKYSVLNDVLYDGNNGTISPCVE